MGIRIRDMYLKSWKGVASADLTRAQAKEAGLPVRTGTVPFKAITRP